MKVLGTETWCSAAGWSLVDIAEEIQARITNQLQNVRLKRAVKTEAHV